MRPRVVRLATLVLVTCTLARPVRAEPEEFGYCTTCHGAQGNGNPAIGAPRIAGLGAWYVSRQLESFRAGRRGAHADDAKGREMRFVSQALPDTAAVQRAAAYAAALAPAAVPRTLSGGDAARGAAAYAPCAACHGARGEGDAALEAPRLAGQADWYLAAQLEAYRAGRRGTHPDDAPGLRMRPMAALLPEAALADVLAHLASLADAETKETPR